VFEKATSNGDHSFEAKHDGKYTYCFGNEHWGSSSKEVSFNVHGVVYVSESDSPQDPLEAEGTANLTVWPFVYWYNLTVVSQFVNSRKPSPRSRTSSRTLSFANVPTETPPRAQTAESNGGTSLSLALSSANLSSRSGG
jgi:hypothetical protein